MEGMKIRIHIAEIKNLNTESKAARIVDKEDTSDVVEIEKKSNFSVKEDFGSTSNRNTDKLCCLTDNIIITQLHDITVNTDESDESDENLNGLKKLKLLRSFLRSLLLF